MRYYFDYEFLEDLLDHESDNNLLDDFFKRFFREIHGRAIFILLPIEREEECVSHPFVRKVLDAGGKIGSRFTFESDADTVDDTPFKFFFLNTVSVEKLRSEHGYFAVNSRTFENTWSTVSNFSEAVEKTFGSEITSWKALKDLALPINFIVFADRYFFLRQDAMSENLFPIFESLKLKKLSKRKVDILVVGKEFSPERIFNNRHIKEAFETLTNYLDNKLGNDAYNLTFIRVDAATIPPDREFHFRVMATNNICLKPGNGFDQFGQDGRRPVLETMSMRLFIRSKTYPSLLPLLAPFKRAFEGVHDVYNDHQSGIRVLTKGEKKHCLIDVVKSEKG